MCTTTSDYSFRQHCSWLFRLFLFLFFATELQKPWNIGKAGKLHFFVRLSVSFSFFFSFFLELSECLCQWSSVETVKLILISFISLLVNICLFVCEPLLPCINVCMCELVSVSVYVCVCVCEHVNVGGYIVIYESMYTTGDRCRLSSSVLL